MTTHSRRTFLRQVSALAAAGIVSPMAMSLAGMTAASAQTADDYKALVYVRMGGGNDHLSMIAPYDADSYARYAQVRQSLALGRDTLVPITAASEQGGLQAAFAPTLGGLAGLYGAGRLAVVPNIGPLVQPTTRADISAGRASLPKLLGSHDDQQNAWAALNDNLSYGWGGRFADILAGANGNAGFTTITATGYTLFTVGARVPYFNVRAYGVPGVFFDPGSALETAVIGLPARRNLLEQAYVDVNARLASGSAALSGAILSPDAVGVPPGNGANNLAQQLSTVARIIGAHGTLGMRRQIFFVDIGGFDTHLGQNDRHPGLMTALNDALVYFDGALGRLGLQNAVTLFTTSEFGRTFVPNGDGTDHGWAGHHMVMGGAVRGGNVYGRLPVADPAGPDFVDGGGQMIPTTAAAQYAATLGRWMGVGDADLATILPDLARFDRADLGFMG